MPTTTKPELTDYILEKEIGRGDLSISYRATRKSDGEAVAVKVIAPQFTFDRLFVIRFKEIMKQSIRLEHPNIVRTFEADEEGDTLFIAREIIEARPLAEIIKEKGAFSPHRMLIVTRQIASALDYAHQHSMTHGDLSASRIYLGANDHTIVADFGQTQAIADTSLVKQGYAIGTPETIAPERVHGQSATRQSDLYSLGILCYQMLAGAPPFTGSPAAVLHAHAYEQPQPLHLVNPNISVALSETIARMLSKGLELRYNTGSEFTRALTAASRGTAPIRAPAAAITQRMEAGLLPPTPLWKRPWVWLTVVVLLVISLLGLGFAGVSLLTASRESAPPPIATPQPAIFDEIPTVAVAAPATPAPPATVNVAVPASSSTPLPPPTDSGIEPTVSELPTATPLALPTPGPPVILTDSPLTNLRLTRAITEDDQPDETGVSFAPGPQPIYLFFDFNGMEPGATWTHNWRWADKELGVFDDTWPESYASRGTAWVYFAPIGGYQPGPYQVTLSVNGQTVSTATFVIQAGGL
jgi:serine/threonine protein kinase